MRKIKKFLYLLFIVYVPIISAAQFLATVPDNQIIFGQPIQLRLQLEGAKPREAIDLTPLAQDFIIYSQQQFSSYSNINGNVTAETGWQVILMPKVVGEFVIPSIGINTDKGRLSTSAIKMTIVQASAADKVMDDRLGVSLVTETSQAKAYVNQPIIYKLKIISYKPMVNVVLDDIKSNDAIIEKIGEPIQYDQNHGGVHAHIIEIRYAITALKPGTIKITPATMHGELQVPSQQAQRNPRFGLFNNLFLDNMFELKPFSLQSDEITLQIIPPAIKTNNWLPLSNLSVIDKWEGIDNPKVGDTITRKVKMIAKGSFAKQLPNASDLLVKQNLKLYTNNPNFSDTYDANLNLVIGTKEEEYSIVLQQAGQIRIPETQIKWWNVRTNKPEVSILPAKTIQVLPATNTNGPDVTVDYSSNNPQVLTVESAAKPESSKERSILLYVSISIIFGMMLPIIGILVYIWLKKKKFAHKKTKIVKDSTKRIVTTAADLRDEILEYAAKHWQTPNNITLNRLGDSLTNNNYIYDIELYAILSKQINSVIYSQQAMELTILLDRWQEFKKTVTKNKITAAQKNENIDYSTLNPT